MTLPSFLLGFIAAGAISAVTFYLLQREKSRPKEEDKVGAKRASKILEDAHNQAEKILEDAQKEARELKSSLLQQEERLEEKEERLREQEEKLRERERGLQRVKGKIEKDQQKLEQELEKRASLTRKEAEKLLLKNLEESLVSQKARIIKEAQEQAKLEAEEKAKEILVSAMESVATEYVPEATVSKVELPSESMKGRIIGKEGRNIRAFERVAGVDIEIDETPKEVRISSFNPIRREIAKRSLEKLIADGRIQPARIEETVERVQKALARELRKTGKDLAYKAGVTQLPAEILTLLGKLKYRTSYGQNQAKHTLEVVNLGKALAREVGAREDLVAKATLLHDIGKVKTVEEGAGSHVELGRKILKAHGFSEEVIHAAMAHHRDEAFRSLEAVLVYIADAISGARPGARLEDYDSYIERIEKLEETAKEFEGVKDSFAISAGREIRVLVEPEQISDEEAVVLAHEIAEKIEKDATYPGTVKVNVIRELRASDIAK
ncbi:MAG: ribonuclease Y [Patescibacteria group bacterium]|nr:ribonuclease Y [Patescibacteria group bacterium]